MKYTKLEQAESAANLRLWLSANPQVYCLVRGVAKNGMSRTMSFFIFGRTNNLTYLDYNIARVLGLSLGKDRGVKVSGCGMDMGFHVLDNLASVLSLPKKFNRQPRYV